MSSSASSNNNGGNIAESSVSTVRGASHRIPPQHAPNDGNNNDNIAAAKQRIESIRQEFYNRYGGKDESLAMLRRGLKTFAKSSSSSSTADQSDTAFAPESLHGTAIRLLSTLVTQQTNNDELAQFVFAFGGYSVTVGRGNHFNQSFPFIFQSITKPLLQSIGIDLIVRNSAIGGIPSFPYGWCLPNFLGKDSNAISWDYGMNEGNGGSGLESYLRHGLSSMDSTSSSPMFLMVDTKAPRLKVLQYYVDKGYLVDPLALGRGDAVKQTLLNLPNDKRPTGLQKWDEWGAPKGSPGQSPWHPKKMEHELMGWMLAMYFVESVDVALDIMTSDEDWRESVLHQNGVYSAANKESLPPPMTDVSDTGVSSVLHGVKKSDEEWIMPPVSCRTSFLPNISGHLESIVVSGLTKDDEDMIKPRDDALFNGGWVMDVGKVERETKEKVNKFGGLGYIDMKTALYGIPSSGTLKLWLPQEGSSNNKNSDDATDYFKSIVFCEVNEKRGAKECNTISDIEFRVGGSVVLKEQVKQIHSVASYLKKDICIHIDIPHSAKISLKDGVTGLDVEATVVNTEVSRENGACSISHVIWQAKS